MRIKAKIFKELVSVMCMVTMIASCAPTNVGAFKVTSEVVLSPEDTKSLNSLNKSLHEVINGYETIKEGCNIFKNHNEFKMFIDTLDSTIKSLNNLQNCEMKNKNSLSSKKGYIDQYFSQLKEIQKYILFLIKNGKLDENKKMVFEEKNEKLQLNEENSKILEDAVTKIGNKKENPKGLLSLLESKIRLVEDTIKQISNTWQNEDGSNNVFKGKDEKADKKSEENSISNSQNNVDSKEVDMPNQNTSDAEILFGSLVLKNNSIFKNLKSKIDHEKFNKVFLSLPKYEELNTKRKCKVWLSEGSAKEEILNEKDIYDQMEDRLKQIKDKVDRLKDKEGMSESMLFMREWFYEVVKLITYDDRSYEDFANKAPQDAMYVFNTHVGICDGISNLIKFGANWFGIPCGIIQSLGESEDPDSAHAYNAIYLEDDKNPNRSGWTILDATWAINALKQNKIVIKNRDDFEDNNEIIKECFPAVFNPEKSFDEANKIVLKLDLHKIRKFISPLYCKKHLSERYEYSLLFCGDVEYWLHGVEGRSNICLKSNDFKNSCSEVNILPELSNCRARFKVGKGIKSIVLKGDQRVDISEAYDLESINTDSSTQYVADNKEKKLIDKNTGNSILFNKENQQNCHDVRDILDETLEDYNKKYDNFMKYIDINKINLNISDIEDNRIKIFKLLAEVDYDFYAKLMSDEISDLVGLMETEIDKFNKYMGINKNDDKKNCLIF